MLKEVKGGGGGENERRQKEAMKGNKRRRRRMQQEGKEEATRGHSRTQDNCFSCCLFPLLPPVYSYSCCFILCPPSVTSGCFILLLLPSLASYCFLFLLLFLSPVQSLSFRVQSHLYRVQRLIFGPSPSFSVSKD